AVRPGGRGHLGGGGPQRRRHRRRVVRAAGRPGRDVRSLDRHRPEPHTPSVTVRGGRRGSRTVRSSGPEPTPTMPRALRSSVALIAFPIALLLAQAGNAATFTVGSATASRGTTATGTTHVPPGPDSALRIP